MRVLLSSVALWFFVCAMIEPFLVGDDAYELLGAFWEFSLCSAPRDSSCKYITLPRAAVQKTFDAHLAL
jgi:hypothetical protein